MKNSNNPTSWIFIHVSHQDIVGGLNLGLMKISLFIETKYDKNNYKNLDPLAIITLDPNLENSVHLIHHILSTSKYYTLDLFWGYHVALTILNFIPLKHYIELCIWYHTSIQFVVLGSHEWNQGYHWSHIVFYTHRSDHPMRSNIKPGPESRDHNNSPGTSWELHPNFKRDVGMCSSASSRSSIWDMGRDVPSPGRFLGLTARDPSVSKSKSITCCDLLVFSSLNWALYIYIFHRLL